MPWYYQIAAVLIAAGLVLSRQPNALLHPQFYAEDGAVWFADAYNKGWFQSLFAPYNGYFQTLPRLAAAFALFWPLRFAPLAMNLVGLFVQILPIPVLLSTRLHHWGDLRFRVLLAFAYLALPNSREVNVVVTEAQWHLALLAVLLVLAEPPRSRLGQVFDTVVFLLSGITGPFCFFLLTTAFLVSRVAKHALRRTPVTISACASAVQIFALLFLNSHRDVALPLGVSLPWFARVLGGEVYLGTLIGSNSVGRWGDSVFLFAVAVAGTVLFVYASWRTDIQFRLFALFSILLFLTSLVSPMMGPSNDARTAWEGLAGSAAIHYWFFPTLAFSWALLALVAGPKSTPLSQAIGVLLVPVILIGIIRDWRHPAYPDLCFARYAALVVASRPGGAVVIPETPPGWSLRLVRR